MKNSYKVQGSAPLLTSMVICARTDSLPPLNSAQLKDLHLSEDEFKRYSSILKHIRQPTRTETTIHKLLGHPDAIQGDMCITCAAASVGLDVNFEMNVQEHKQRIAERPP